MKITLGKYLFLVFFVAVSLTCFAKPQKIILSGGILDLSNGFQGKDIVVLNGEWEIYYNQLLTPDEINKYQPDFVIVPHLWKKKRYPDLHYATYRARIIVPHDSTAIYRFNLTKIRTAANIWINGQLCYSIGQVSSDPSEHKPGLYNFDDFFISQENIPFRDTFEIVIQVSNYTTYKAAGIVDVIYFGTAKKIIHKQNNCFGLGYALIGIYIIVALYFIFIFIIRKKEVSSLLFGLLSLSIITRTMFSQGLLEYYAGSFRVFWFLNYFGIILFSILIVLFYYASFPKEFSKKVVYAITSVLVLLLIFSFFPVYFTDKYGFLVFFSVYFSLLYIVIFVLPKAIKNKRNYALINLVAILVLIIIYFLSYLRVNGIINLRYLTAYGFILFTIIEAFKIINKLSVSLKRNEELTRMLQEQNFNLEEIVRERTAEIEKQKRQLFESNEELQMLTEDLKNQTEEYKAAGEEFERLSKKLWETNLELEKLTIAVSHTDNAVLIFDNKLSLEWVNKAFLKLHEISFNEALDSVKIDNYLNDIELGELLATRKSKRFQYFFNKKNTVWLQVTITPVFQTDNFYKIVAIESDISELKEAEAKIIEQNKHIKSSIEYASTIQKSILPEIEVMKKYLNLFVLYRPKDIVSGDFYWFHHQDNIDYIAVADCTGHGVPGALMSMIGSTLLNEIIINKKILSPDEILCELKKDIYVLLRQNSTENIEGMDIGLCKIDRNKKELVYAGAKHPLFYYNSEKRVLERYRGSLVMIGGFFSSNNKFENFVLKFHENDVIYLASDGYIDQNRKDRKKIGTKNFVDLLQNIAELNINAQLTALIDYLNNWQKNELQRDDITVIGIKF